MTPDENKKIQRLFLKNIEIFQRHKILGNTFFELLKEMTIVKQPSSEKIVNLLKILSENFMSSSKEFEELSKIMEELSKEKTMNMDQFILNQLN